MSNAWDMGRWGTKETGREVSEEDSWKEKDVEALSDLTSPVKSAALCPSLV